MDLDYWKARCEAAERALRLARGGLHMKAARRTVVAALGDLKPGETLQTGDLANRLRWQVQRTRSVLSDMERVGLVDRADQGKCGGPGHQVRWRLGHLVQEPDQ